MHIKQNLRSSICRIANKYSVDCKLGKVLNDTVVIVESKDRKFDNLLVYARNQIYNTCMKHNTPMLVFDYSYEDREMSKMFTVLEKITD